jgi:hypothetical protein
VTLKGAGTLLALLTPVIAIAAQKSEPLPQPFPPPTTYSAPTPAPMAPPVNPGPAVVPPAGLSPLLAQPGPVYPMPERAAPAYPPAPTPGPIDQQKMQAYRNSLLGQQRRLERQGVSPDSQRGREIQQQLDQTNGLPAAR